MVVIIIIITGIIVHRLVLMNNRNNMQGLTTSCGYRLLMTLKASVLSMEAVAYTRVLRNIRLALVRLAALFGASRHNNYVTRRISCLISRFCYRLLGLC